jgi:putative nucleotidyltransferase with HDIG domain
MQVNYAEARLGNSGRNIIQLNAIDEVFDRMDRSTQSHGRRVAIYSMRLAKRIGLAPDEIENIGIGGLLHDIGKISLSQRIFRNKKPVLSKDMLEEVRRHPSIGASILQDIPFPAVIIGYVHYHHERVDGTGYPFGLMADEIPLGAKIISVADWFDAITSDRSYQKGKSRQEAFKILDKARGRGLCPELVESFIEEIQEKGMLAIRWYLNRLALSNPNRFQN